MSSPALDGAPADRAPADGAAGTAHATSAAGAAHASGAAEAAHANGAPSTAHPAGAAVSSLRARSVFAPIEAGRAEMVARRLSQAISLGLLLDGERLPAESHLAGQFGVSPMTLREALAALRGQGLVETRRGRGGGSFVRVPRGPQPAHLESRLRRLSLHEIQDIGDHRAAVAGAAARLAAQRALDGDVAALREHVARLHAATTLTGRRRADARIHIEIAAAAQSPRLTRQEMDLWSDVGDLVWLPVTVELAREVSREHDAIADAIGAQRPDLARRLAEEHVRAETDRLAALRLTLAAP